MEKPGEKLLQYLNCFGILSCNVNPFLPALPDIGCAWEDVAALIDARELFYCKAWRGRTVYLSREAYRLMKACRAARPSTPEADRLYGMLSGGPPLGTDELKRLAGLDPKAYAKGFQRLLEDMRVTALKNGRPLNPSWSTFLYGTAEAWERLAGTEPCGLRPEEARERLRALLGPTVPDREFARLVR